MGKSLIITGADFSVNGMPPEFQALDWIGVSTNHLSYISSGIRLKATTKFYMDFTTVAVDSSFPNSSSRGLYLGAMTNNYSVLNLWFQASINNGNVVQRLSVGYGNTEGSPAHWKEISLSILDGNRHTLEVTPSGYTFDGATTAWADSTWGINEGSGGNPVFYLDASSTYNAPTDDSRFATRGDFVRIHRFKIYEGNTIVFDAIPVTRVADGKVGYYDYVSGEYKFRNDNTVPSNSNNP